jgi:hypothetical protein
VFGLLTVALFQLSLNSRFKSAYGLAFVVAAFLFWGWLFHFQIFKLPHFQIVQLRVSSYPKLPFQVSL